MLPHVLVSWNAFVMFRFLWLLFSLSPCVCFFFCNLYGEGILKAFQNIKCVCLCVTYSTESRKKDTNLKKQWQKLVGLIEFVFFYFFFFFIILKFVIKKYFPVPWFFIKKIKKNFHTQFFFLIFLIWIFVSLIRYLLKVLECERNY